MGSAAAEGSGQWAVHAVVLSVKGCGVSALVVQLCTLCTLRRLCTLCVCAVLVCAVSKSWGVVEHPFAVASMCNQAMCSATFVQ